MTRRAQFCWRPTDVQCGLFASGKALLRYHVPFTYIENCWLDSPLFKRRDEKFVRVVTIMKDFNGMRVGQSPCGRVSSTVSLSTKMSSWKNSC